MPVPVSVMATAGLTAPGTILRSWSFDPTVVAAVFVPGALYVWGVGRIRRPSAVGGRRWGSYPGRGRTIAFLSGLAVTFLALQSPLATYSRYLFSVHMVQHLLLTMVAAPLMVAGGPITLALRASRPRGRRVLLSVLHSWPVKVLAFPVVAWGLFVAAMWGTHFSPFYGLSLEHQWIHSVEHAAYMSTALLFWWPVLAVDPAPFRMTHPARLLYLFLAMPQSTFLGLAIYGSSRILYLPYVRASALVGVSALSDQHLAGALMWTSSMVLLLPVMAYVLFDWMRRDEREAERIDARLARGRVGGPL